MVSILPNEICALISTYLDEEGDFFRKQAGNVIIKEIRNGNTYGNGVLHSFNDQPAEIWVNGTQKWYKNGQLHRVGDKPAVIYMDGTQSWYQYGELHRDIFNKIGDKPVVIYANGTCLYKF